MIFLKFKVVRPKTFHIFRNFLFPCITALSTIAFFCSLPPFAFASSDLEKSANKKIHLTIDKAIEIAFERNRDLQTSRRDLRSSESNYRSTKAQYYPTLEGNFLLSNTTTDSANVALENLYATGLQLSANIPLDLSGTIGRSVQQASIALVTSKSNYALQSQDLVDDVYNNYTTLLAAAKEVEINRQQVNLANEQLRIAKALLKSGRVPEVDLFTASVQLNNEEQSLKASEGDYLIALANLKNLLRIEQDAEIIPTSKLSFDPVIFVFEDAVGEAMQNRLEVKIAELNIESAKIALRSTYDPHRPSLGVSGGYGYTVSDENLPDAFDFRLNEPAWSVSASLNVPIFLFQGGAIKESKYRAKLNVEQSEADLAQTKESIALEIRNALTALNNSEARVRLVQDNIEMAKKSLSITETRYRMGKTNYLELVNTRNNLRDAEVNRLNAIIEHINAKVEIYKAIGRPLAYINSFNR